MAIREQANLCVPVAFRTVEEFHLRGLCQATAEHIF